MKALGTTGIFKDNAEKVQSMQAAREALRRHRESKRAER